MAFLRLYRRLHLFRAKDPLDSLVVCGHLPQGLVFQLDLLQSVRQAGVALPHPAIVPLQTLKFPPQLHIGQIQGAQHLDDLRQQELDAGEITRDEYFERKLNWPATCDR